MRDKERGVLQDLMFVYGLCQRQIHVDHLDTQVCMYKRVFRS